MDKYSVILFDWDGCLARTLELWVDVCDAALTKHGIRALRAEIWANYRIGGVGRLFNVADQKAFSKDIGEIARQKITNVELYEGALEMLGSVSRTKKLALVTNTRSALLYRHLEAHGLDKYFQAIVTGEDVSLQKPHPEGIEKVIMMLGADRKRTVMIGDSVKDIKAAANAGVDSVLMYPESHRVLYDRDELLSYKPTYVARSFGILQQQLSL